MMGDPLDNLGSDLQHLYSLLDIAVGFGMDLPRTDETSGRIDQIQTLLWVSRDMAHKAYTDLAAYPPEVKP